jgi:hypothetical protein
MGVPGMGLSLCNMGVWCVDMHSVDMLDVSVLKTLCFFSDKNYLLVYIYYIKNDNCSLLYVTE